MGHVTPGLSSSLTTFSGDRRALHQHPIILLQRICHRRTWRLRTLGAMCLLAGGMFSASVDAQVAPATAVGVTSATQTVTVTIASAGTTNATLGTAIQVLTMGASGLDFAYVSGGTCATNTTYAVGQTCTVEFSFTPITPGLRMGAVLLVNDADPTAPLATAYISGIGNAPLAGFTPGTISTVAGGGTATFHSGSACPGAPSDTATDSDGDGCPAVNATVPGDGVKFGGLGSIALDGKGDLYIADNFYSNVREVSAATGIISLAVGSGGQLNSPGGIAVDGAGNLYIADTDNNRIRKMTAATGIITTVAGTGTACAKVSNVYSCNDGGQATAATLYHPFNVALDGAGNLYITDFLTERVRMVTAATGIITTIAGTGVQGSSASDVPAASAQIAGPNGIAVDGAGNVYFTDTGSATVKMVAGPCSTTPCSTTPGNLYIVAGNGSKGYGGDGGPATSAELYHPNEVTVDGAGNLYIADGTNNLIRKVTAATGIITTIAGSVTNAGNQTNDGYSGDGGPATSAELYDPSDVKLDRTGNLYFVDSSNNVVREVTASAAAISFATSTSVGATDTADGANTLTLTNNGNTSLIFPSPATSTNPAISSGFSIGGSSTCPQLTSSSNDDTLDSGADCTYLINFAPVVAGGISGSLVTTDSDLNLSSSTQSVVLSGTATAATGTTTQTITFPQPTTPVTYGASPLTLTATASSGLPVFYTVSGPATVSGSVLTFTGGVGPVTVTANQNGNGTYAPATAVSDVISVMAPETDVDVTSATMTVTLTITTAGTTNATLGTAIQVLTQGVSGLDFAYVSGGTCAANTAYTAGQTCTVGFSFTPSAPGLRLGAVVLANDASPAAPLATAYISGIGYGPLVGFTPGTITTFAGDGTAGYLGDSGAATGAELDAPAAVALDGADNLYIADKTNNVIRKVTAATGIINTVAGNGTACTTSASTGCMDGGVATSAELNVPQGVAVDGAGNLYIADTGDESIRMVAAATGIISTVAGNGTAGYSGDGAAATAAELRKPAGLAVDGAGNVYIADEQNVRIREVAAATGIISTVAGGGSATFSAGNACPGTPTATATDAFGDGCPAINATTADSARFVIPASVTVDGAGNLYIGDSAAAMVREVTEASGIISAVAGNGTTGSSGDGTAATSAQLRAPAGVSVDGAGNLYIADEGNQRIRKVLSATGIISTVAGTGTAGYSGDSVAATAAELKNPNDIAVDSSGNLYIADQANARIRRVTAAANPIAFSTSTPMGTTDTTDGAMTLTITNNGNNALTFSTPSTGANPSISPSFTIGGNSTCPQLSTGSQGALASGTNCTELISFAPLSAGSVAGSLVLTDNSTITQQTVNLTGTATQQTPTLTLAAVPTVTFPNVSTLSVSLAWTGSGPVPTGAVTFSVDSGSALTARCTGTTSPITCTYSGSFSAGPHALNASYEGDTNYASASVAAGSFTVLDAVSQLVISAPGAAVAGTPFSVTVTAKDAAGNIVTSDNDAVNLTLTVQTPVLGAVTLSGGTGSAMVTLTATGTVTLTGIDTTTSLSGQSGSIVVSAAPAAKVVIGGYPVTVYAGVPETGTVTVEDRYGNTETGYSGTANVTTSESATPIPVTITTGVGSFATSFAKAAINQSITTSISPLTSVPQTGITVNALPSYVVSVTTDDASGAPGNCVNQNTGQSSTGGTNNSNCSLRDALAADSASGAGYITFSSARFSASDTAAQNTITLTGGSTLSIPSNTTIQGLTTGSGAMLQNLVAVDGGSGSYGPFSVFTVNSGTTAASIANLTIQNGTNSSGDGGGISNSGRLTLTRSTLYRNGAQLGGAIYNLPSAMMTVTDSTFQNNSTKSGGGGAIGNDGTLTVIGSTFYGNSSSVSGGGIANFGALTVANSTFSGNSAIADGGGIYAPSGTLAIENTILSGNSQISGSSDCYGSCPANDSDGNLVGGTVSLAALGNYGGPTQTLIPLPGSTAVCAGLQADIPSGVTTDQRSEPNTNATYPGYSPGTACVDTGAVQTNYSLAFAQQPSTVPPNVTMSPAPEVELLESGATFADKANTFAIPLALTTGPGTLTGGLASTSVTTGIATYAALSIDTPAAGDVLTATLALNPAANPAPTLTLASNAFNVSKVGTETLLTVSSASLTPGQNETLTAQVLSSITGTPTGTVSFYDGTTLLSTVTMSGGTASYSTTTLAPGVTHTLSAVYSGDANFAPSSSATNGVVPVAPLDFTMTLTGPSNLTVVPGQSISYQVQVTPDYGSYAGTVNFAVSGLPPGATVTFSPSSIAANGGPQTITVTIHTAPATAMLHREPQPPGGRKLAPFALAFLLLSGAGSLRKRGRALFRFLCVAVLLASGAVVTLTLSGCGSTSGFFAQAQQDYTVTITATAGPLEHTTTVTLNVQ
jgi:sugar lactone lactonase YvrE